MTELDADRLRASLSANARDCIDSVDVFREIDSTNTYLMDQPAPQAGRMRVALADHQTKGKGRQQRQWLSMPGGSICLSISYTFRKAPEALPAVTLALGVGAANALTELGVAPLSLKWPNDILVANAKLAGILTESQARSGDAVNVVAGIGVNVYLPELGQHAFELGWQREAIDLNSLLDELPDRSHLSGLLVDSWFRTLQTYDYDGFENFGVEYQTYNGLIGKSLLVDTPTGKLRGIALGVDSSGALLIDDGSGSQPITSGSILTISDVPSGVSPSA